MITHPPLLLHVQKSREDVVVLQRDVFLKIEEKLMELLVHEMIRSATIGRGIEVVGQFGDVLPHVNYKQSLQIQLEGTENRINEARQKYNMAVQDYNQDVRTFPNVVFAGMFGFNRMEKFEAAAGAEKAPELNFNE
ncbi:LemA family protein [Hallella mizrahii]